MNISHHLCCQMPEIPDSREFELHSNPLYQRAAVLLIFPAIGFEGQRNSGCRKKHLHYQQDGGILEALLSRFWKEYPAHTTRKYKPAYEGYQFGATKHATIVNADD